MIPSPRNLVVLFLSSLFRNNYSSKSSCVRIRVSCFVIASFCIFPLPSSRPRVGICAHGRVQHLLGITFRNPLPLCWLLCCYALLSNVSSSSRLLCKTLSESAFYASESESVAFTASIACPLFCFRSYFESAVSAFSFGRF